MFIKLYSIALPIFFALDMLWLGLISTNFYKGQIGFLMKPSINWTATLTFYGLFIAGLVFFAILPSFEKGSFLKALLLGASFGFITYATYDLTNLATLKDWPLAVSLVDMLWGTTLGALVTSLTYLIATKIGI